MGTGLIQRGSFTSCRNHFVPCGNVYICGVVRRASTLSRPRSGTKLRVPEFRNALARSGIIAHSKRHVETHPFTPRRWATSLMLLPQYDVNGSVSLLFHWRRTAGNFYNWPTAVILGNQKIWFVDATLGLWLQLLTSVRRQWKRIDTVPLTSYCRQFL